MCPHVHMNLMCSIIIYNSYCFCIYVTYCTDNIILLYFILDITKTFFHAFWISYIYLLYRKVYFIHIFKQNKNILFMYSVDGGK